MDSVDMAGLFDTDVRDAVDGLVDLMANEFTEVYDATDDDRRELRFKLLVVCATYGARVMGGFETKFRDAIDKA